MAPAPGGRGIYRHGYRPFESGQVRNEFKFRRPGRPPGIGMLLGSVVSGVDLEMAAAGNTEVVRAKTKTMKSLGLGDTIEDILISLGRQYHIIRPVEKHDGCSSTTCSIARARTW